MSPLALSAAAVLASAEPPGPTADDATVLMTCVASAFTETSPSTAISFSVSHRYDNVPAMLADVSAFIMAIAAEPAMPTSVAPAPAMASVITWCPYGFVTSYPSHAFTMLNAVSVALVPRFVSKSFMLVFTVSKMVPPVISLISWLENTTVLTLATMVFMTSNVSSSNPIPVTALYKSCALPAWLMSSNTYSKVSVMLLNASVISFIK